MNECCRPVVFQLHCLSCLAALAENGRLNKVSGVIGAFAKIMSAHRGEVMCVVTTAKVNISDTWSIILHATVYVCISS